jgi:3-phenylpropionate/trans-cinnamate dioxygenase ferredoxin component
LGTVSATADRPPATQLVAEFGRREPVTAVRIAELTRPKRHRHRIDNVWSYAADAASIKPGEAIRFVTEKGVPLAVFNVGGEYLCTSDTCTHEASSLADGYIDGDTVECAFHFAKFSLRTGAVLCPPAVMPLKTFAVKVEDGKVYVDL